MDTTDPIKVVISILVFRSAFISEHPPLILLDAILLFLFPFPFPQLFSGMLLKNTSPLTLEDGSLTVIDGDAYAGEALLERLKPGEDRLISFAVDLGTLVNVREEGKDRLPV